MFLLVTFHAKTPQLLSGEHEETENRVYAEVPTRIVGVSNVKKCKTIER